MDKSGGIEVTWRGLAGKWKQRRSQCIRLAPRKLLSPMPTPGGKDEEGRSTSGDDTAWQRRARVCTNRVVEVTWRGLAGRIEAAALSMYTTSASKAAISHANTRGHASLPLARVEQASASLLWRRASPDISKKAVVRS